MGAGSNLSVSKEAKTNYMDRFIFSRGGGVVLGDHLLIPFFYFLLISIMSKKCTIPRRLHLKLRQLLYRLNKYDFSNNMS